MVASISARAVAAGVLARVWVDNAFAAPALDAALRDAALEPREAALATELVYGVLRTQGGLEERLTALSAKRRSKLGPRARAHLLIAAYSIACLERVPAFAAVSEAVTGVAEAEGPSASGYANAILRRLAQEVEARGRPDPGELALASIPGWLRGSLRRALGRAGAKAYLAGGALPPPPCLCVRDASTRDAVVEALSAARPEASVERGLASPHAIIVRGGGDLRRLDGYERDWIIQEEGSQVVALAARAQRGETVLDACAGRGNKSWLLSASVGDEGAVDAADLYESKLAELREGPRAGLVRATYVVDWFEGVGAVPGGYDRALVDAPCSGVGTIRRRPEIALRRTAEDVARLAELQVRITSRVASRVRDGGVLVYAVCSVLLEETTGVVDALVGRDWGEVRLERIDEPDAEQLLLPATHGTDGYFVARLRVRAGAPRPSAPPLDAE